MLPGGDRPGAVVTAGGGPQVPGSQVTAAVEDAVGDPVRIAAAR